MGAPKLPLQRLRVEARDLVELVLLPLVGALFPWKFGYRCLRWLGGALRPYEPASVDARQKATARGWVGDAPHWLAVRRTLTLVDHADLYLSRSRSDRWLAKHVEVQGSWPAPDEPGVLITVHWGAGMWGLRHARAAGLKAHALVAPLQGAHFKGRSVLHAYARARTAEVARALGCPTLDTSSSLRPALRALRRGEQVMAAIDVPSDQVSASHPVTLLGETAFMPTGLLRLAVDQRLPVTVYMTGLRVADGRRSLTIHQLGRHDDLPALSAVVFALLDNAIRQEPPAWHFWTESARFFRDD